MLRGKLVSKSTHRMNQLLVESSVDLRTKLLHEGIERVVLYRSLITPNGVNDRISPKNDARVPNKEFEQQKFRACEIDRPAGA